MKHYIYIIACFLLFACHDVKVGYLETESAKYYPNILEVTKSEDPTEKLHIVSPPIEGIEGTQPIKMSIHNVSSSDGDAEAFLKEVSIRGNGAFDIPAYNNISSGSYDISIKVANEGYSVILEDIYTIIIK